LNSSAPDIIERKTNVTGKFLTICEICAPEKYKNIKKGVNRAGGG
jgi:hypothetical protein